MAILFQELDSLISQLNQVRNNCSDPDEQAQLQSVLRELFALYQEQAIKKVDENTAAYKDALDALRNAQASAAASLKKLQQVAVVIQDAKKAAQVVDKILRLFGKALV